MPKSPFLTYLTSAPFPLQKASNVQMMQMGSAFAACGVPVYLFGRVGTPQLTEKALLAYYAVHTPFHIHLEAMPQIRWGARWFQLRLAMRAWRAWVAVRPKHSHWLVYTRGRDALSARIALALGAQVVYEVHGRPNSAHELQVLRLLHRHPRGRLVGLTAALVEVYVQEYGFSAERWVVAPDGVDLSRFEPALSLATAREQVGLAQGERWVVYVGGLYAGRGLEELFTAMVGQVANLLVVGGRNEQEIAHWQALAHEIGLNGVKFTGFVAPSLVPAYLQAADVLAMPYSRQTRTASGEDTTAFMSPLKLYEYMAARRPIVASDLPALRTLLSHRRNALLAQPDDSTSLAQAIRQLLENPVMAQSLARQARIDVQSHTWQARAAYILDSVAM
ncbi:MAG TPA: glycosyltransferase family 4 protein [Anaerolineales bacterium]|nr:glycosyltransferase family 4 protein [Anaerolineales bacterium]